MAILSWKDGNYVPEDRLGTSAWDAHYFFGYAVFDAFRTYNHKLWDVDYHLDRFYKSAKLTGIDIKLSKKELLEQINRMMEINARYFKDDEYRFMVFASPGNFPIYDDIGKSEPKLTIQLTTMSRYAKFIYPYLGKGWTSLITNQKQIPSRFLDTRIKSCSRLHYGMANMECEKRKEPTNPILLDEHGNICESSGANIAFAKGHTIHIPTGTDMLQGSTIRTLKAILGPSFEIKTGTYKPYDLIDSNCILYTSTYSGITPSYKLIYNSNEYNLKYGDKIYEDIMKCFSAYVNVDILKQWKDWYESS